MRKLQTNSLLQSAARHRERNGHRHGVLTAALALLPSLAGAQTPLIRTDFSGVWTSVNTGRATGTLPPGWSDNSSWAQVWTTYSKVTGEGEPYLRIDVTRIDSGNGQLMNPLPALTTDSLYRLTMRVRSADKAQLTFGVRRNGPPYNYLWTMSETAPPEWRELSYVFSMSPVNYDAGFYLLIPSASALELSAFSLTRMTRDEYIAELIAKDQANPGGNIARQTRFPLGLAPGWTLDRDTSDGDIAIVSSEGTALHVVNTAFASLWSAPFFPPRPFEPYTASVWAKGSGALKMSVHADSRYVSEANFTLSPEWKRLTFPFTPSLFARYHALRFDSSGEYWLDRLQIERGGAATEFRGGPEVALAASEAEMPAATRVYLDGDAPVFRWAVMDAAPGSSLRLRLVNSYDETKELPSVVLNGGAMQTGAARFDAFPSHPYGSVRVEAWIEGVSTVSEAVLHRLRTPRCWMRDCAASQFGVHSASTRRHIWMAKAMGVNWTRLHDAGSHYIGWYALEERPGEWRFFDADLWRYRVYGMKVLGTLATAPGWASYYGKPDPGYFEKFFQPLKLEPFQNYVRVVVRRYLGVIDAWDVWNEPWNAGWWAVSYDTTKQQYVTTPQAPADFAKLQEAAYNAAKEVDPSATVLGMPSHDDLSTGPEHVAADRWVREMAAAGGLQWADVLNYHCYTGALAGTPESAAERAAVQSYLPVLNESGKPPKPYWMTEGSPVFQSFGQGLLDKTLGPGGKYENNGVTGDRIARYVLSVLASGAEKVFLYSMHSHGTFSGSGEWRVLVTENGEMHPSGAAMSALAWFLEGKKFAGVTRTETAYEYRFVPSGPASGRGPDAGSPRQAVSSSDATVTVIAPLKGTIRYRAGGREWDVFGN